MDMTINWDQEHMNLAMKIVRERFAMNSIAGHFAPHTMIDQMTRTIPSNRFDYGERIVIDNETLNLFEPFAICNFTLAQMNEFGNLSGEMLTGETAMQNRIVTTITRAASALARWHDFLFFVGLEQNDDPSKLKPPGVDPGKAVTNPVPVSLRQAAIQAEKDLNNGNENPILVKGPALNEGLVAAVYQAVLQLETRGYYTTYHLVLGEGLWEELYRPTQGSLVLPKDRIEPTLIGGHIHRTTTLPRDEALIASLDGPTIDCVTAGSGDQHPNFALLPAVTTTETIYKARIVEAFVPRIRENQAIVRLKIDTTQAAGKGNS
ncbi:encapsulin [Methylomonas sp. MO1]|uniref:encapsulin n=1 Tax=unclassified Methylomonas TaxID=2608980 RepID=UPI0004791B99|nr:MULTISPECIES: encapsulin [unclassified Methylomonas]MDT4292019.1 encapsulin [Methylomonas sp. MO1]